MNTDNARPGTALYPRRIRRALLGSVCLFGVASALSLSLACAPAAARTKARHNLSHKDKEAEHVSKLPFGDIPKGPLQIFISINQKKLHLYSDGTHVTDALVATGMPGHPTPMGVFSVIQRDRFHHSNIYSNAPMPFMERITWSGVALHEGTGLGHPASHGCIRMPGEFAARLWTLPTMGMRVIIARNELKPSPFADPHLFVHKDRPKDQTAAVPENVRTAQSDDKTKVIDASSPLSSVAASPANPTGSPAAAASPSNPAELGLRASKAADAIAPAPAASDPPKPDAPAAADPAAPASIAGDAPKPDTSAQQAAPATPAPAVAQTPPANAEPDVPMPLAKPAKLADSAPPKKTPIAIFVSRKEKKIYVRQNFEPLFDAAIVIDHPEQPLGTHVFTAMAFLDDKSTFRWNVVSLPADPPKPARNVDDDRRFARDGRERRRGEQAEKPPTDLPAPQTPEQALARIAIPQDVIDHISDMIFPGSSLIVSDQGLGEETGEGTDFIVVTR